MKDEVLSSPIRWAGSKKRILNDMLELFKKDKDNYVEPFLGSGVVMINVLNNPDVLQYKNYYVNDINGNIINFYKDLKSRPKKLIHLLQNLSEKYNCLSISDKEKMYYAIREQFNSSKDNKSVYFYFLMKVGFNGVYRENKNGKFNVPFGRKEKFVVNESDLLNVSKLIRNVKFYNLSYEKFLRLLSKKGILDSSFIYCDPPYIPDDKLVSQKQELYTSGNFNHYDFVLNIKKYNNANVIISMSDSTKARFMVAILFQRILLISLEQLIHKNYLNLQKYYL